jgi:ferredoxin-NADP reductase
MVQPAFQSRLLEKVPQVADIVTFRLERPQDYEYQAGQWFVVSFSDAAGMREHHFTLSSSPHEPVLEFTTRLRGTEFKNALDALPIGTKVGLEGPYGAFTLPEEAARVVLIAGGIGITAPRSMLRWVAAQGRAARVGVRSIVLLFANRFEHRIPFRDELRRLEAQVSGLRVIHVLSQPGEGWRGYRGHIDREILVRELVDPEDWACLVSGPPAFGEAVRGELVAWGAQPSSIKVEKYDGY